MLEFPFEELSLCAVEKIPTYMRRTTFYSSCVVSLCLTETKVDGACNSCEREIESIASAKEGSATPCWHLIGVGESHCTQQKRFQGNSS